MRFSRLFAPTLKEDPKEAEVVSHRLLMRAGYIRRVAAGIYDFLPLGLRAMRRIETIVREEMDRAGAQELLMPAVQPAELWKESGRWEYYGPELLRFKDRRGGDFCMGPTHEEVITSLVAGEVRSYRDLPLNLYQIQSKFRDEIRPRAGLMRGREFVMKDAYSFDIDEAGAHKTYQAMFDAYCRIFTRCGLDYRAVEADTGNIGGSLSHEFQVLADSGEDAIASCPDCGYTANIEKAAVQAPEPAEAATAALGEVVTPGMRSVEQVAGFLGCGTDRILKTLIFVVDDNPVAVVVRGDHAVNEIKVKAALGGKDVLVANDETVRRATGMPVGFVGPIGLTIPVLVDPAARSVADAVVGAGREDLHITGFFVDRDLPNAQVVDVRMAGAGDPCGRCGGAFGLFKGIETGHVFYLGTKYSVPMKATYLSEAGTEHPIAMGCYGIGVSRILAAAIEQNHDSNGIVWPVAIAPYRVIVLPMQGNDEAVVAAAASIYSALQAAGVDAILDDRDLRPGVKFKDADLIGIPYRITVGARSLAEGKVELKERRGGENELVATDSVVDEVVARIRVALAGGAA